MRQIVIEHIAPDKFRLSVDAVTTEFSEDELRTALRKQLQEHAKSPRDFADKLIRDTGRGRIEVNFRARINQVKNSRPVTPLPA